MNCRPLSDLEVLAEVRLLKGVPPTTPEPEASALRRIFQAASALRQNLCAVLTIWPDGTFAVLLHNPDWKEPRPEQLVRAYRRGHAAGIRMHLSLDALGSPEDA